MSVTDENRLSDERSPYLRQHADNPVNWQPWDEGALAAARERDVPIFLSSGYSACHWCHVMADESFEDETVAALLNERFVPIKIDREERPDLDRLYQTICGMVTGHGGWPLSAWLTPDGRPFYVGTYFPKESKHGRPGFVGVLENVATSWREDREEIENRADQWQSAIAGELEETPEPADEAPGTEVLGEAAATTVRSADREYGGFGRGQKFPQAGRLHLLLRANERTDRSVFRDIAIQAFDAMATGGLRDHVGGGFHRYVTDRKWVVPHFEKMLYDNAELARAYIAAYQATGYERYAAVARETLGFVERELTHPEGGFFSTLDAQSPPPASRRDVDAGAGDPSSDADDPSDDAEEAREADGEREEGAFYVWMPAEVREAVDDETAAELFRARYGITEGGNFEGRTTVLTISASIEKLADEHDLSPEAVEAELERAREQVFEARAGRPRPPRDEKVLSGWNGLMIGAFAEGAIAIDEAYAEPAETALAFVREHLWDPEEGRLSRRYKDGEVKIDGYLEDYAFLARGALGCYEASGDVDHLRFALDLARAIETEFWDPEAETLYFTSRSGESLIARPQELNDQSTPSSVGVACETLLALSKFVPHERFETIADAVVCTHADTLRSDPTMRSTLVLAADRNATGWLECTVVTDALPEAWRERIGQEYLPDRLLSVRPPAEESLQGWLDTLDLEAPPPIWAGRDQLDGDPTIYVCRDFTCSPPQTDIEAALSWAGDLAPGGEAGFEPESDLGIED